MTRKRKDKMDGLTRKRVGELIDRTALAGNDNAFELTFYEATKRVLLKVVVGEYYIYQVVPLAKLPEAVARALEATDE